MKLNELATQIHLPVAMEEIILKKAKDYEKKLDIPTIHKIYQEGILKYPEMIDDLNDARQILQDEENIGELWLQLSLACCAFEEYQKRGIPKEVYFNTMKFYTRTIEEEKKIYDKWTFQTLDWGYRQLFLKIFRLNSLEFELLDRNEDKEIHIHIPGDSVLSREAKDKTYKNLQNFLNEFFPNFKNIPIFCESWLLSPLLGNLLSPDSNLLAFQQDFTLLTTNIDDDSFIKWLFWTTNKDYGKFPENTSLQKKVKAFILDGGKIGTGSGKLKS